MRAIKPALAANWRASSSKVVSKINAQDSDIVGPANIRLRRPRRGLSLGGCPEVCMANTFMFAQLCQDDILKLLFEHRIRSRCTDCPERHRMTAHGGTLR